MWVFGGGGGVLFVVREGIGVGDVEKVVERVTVVLNTCLRGGG